MKKIWRWGIAGALIPVLAWGNWTEVTKFVEGSEDGNLSAGYSMDSDNAYLVVGAPDENGSYGPHDGAVYIYKRSGSGEWVPQDRIAGYYNESLGTDVAVRDMGSDGVYIAAGAPDFEFYSPKTHTTIYRDEVKVYSMNMAGDFVAMKVFSDANGTGLGTSVDLAGFLQAEGSPANSTIVDKGIMVVAGEPFSSEADGKVVTYAFSLMDGNDSNWKSFTVSDPGLIYNHYGHAVAVTEERNGALEMYGNNRAHLAVGAPDEDVQNAEGSQTYPDKGAVYVYKLSGTFSDGFSWTKEARLTQDVDGYLLDDFKYSQESRFGTSVDLTLWHLVVGALKKNVVSSQVPAPYPVGEADLFSLHDVTANSWDLNRTFRQPEDPNLGGSERFGYSVAIDGLRSIAVGAPDFGDGGAVFVYGFDRDRSDWQAEGMIVGRSAGALGTSVETSFYKIIAGDPDNDSVSVFEWKEQNMNPALLMYLLN